MNVNIISTYKEFLKLEKDWKNIFEKSETNNIFISWEWCSLWLKHFGANQKLLILVIEDNEEVIGIAPLIISEGKPVVTLIGSNRADYADFLILRDRYEVIGMIVNFLIKSDCWRQIDLKRIPESSPNFTALRDSLKELKYPYLFRENCISPYVKIKGGWNDYYKSVSKGIKQDIRTAHNKFKLAGDFSFQTYNEDTYRTLLDVLFELHKKRQDYKVGGSLFEVQANRDFFYDLGLTFIKLGWASFSALKINNKIISVVFAVKYKGVFYYWFPAFDPEFIKYSPGKTHIYNLLKDCFEQGCKEFDFMRGDEEYKFKWANNVLVNYELKVYRNKLYLRIDALKVKYRSYIKDLYMKYPLFKKMLIKISKNEFLQAPKT